LVWGNLVAVIGNLMLIPMLRRFGDKRVALTVIFLAVVTCLASYGVTNFFTMSLFAILLGGTLSCLSAFGSVFVIHGTDGARLARLFCGLHMMYGIGSFLGSMSVEFFLSLGFNWNAVFMAFLAPLSLLTAFLVFRIPSEPPQPGPPPTVPRGLSKVQLVILVAFCIYVAGEVMTSMWMVTFLVEAKGLTVTEATPYLTGFFLMMAVSRGLCFLHLRPRHELPILIGCLVVSILCSALGHSGWYWGFSLAGLLGPYFPLYLARVNRSFPEQARSLTLIILGSVQGSLLILNLVVGGLTDRIGIRMAYWLPPGLLAVAIMGLILYLAMESHSAGHRSTLTTGG